MQDPRLRGLPNEGVVIDDSGRKLYEGFGGHMIGEFDTKATVMPSSTNWLPNQSFPTRVEGFGFGGFDQPVPRSLLFRDTVQNMRDIGKNPNKDYRTFQLAPQVQIIDQEWIDNVGRYLDRANSLGLQDMLISRYDEGGAVESDTQRFRREAEERIAADRQGYIDFIEKRKRLHGNKHPLRQIADQAARGVGSQVLALDDEGNLALPIGSDGIRAPGIYHHALSLPYAVGSMFGAEGPVMDWSQEHDKKAGAINKRVADALDTNVEPRGLPQHLAASAGMMATQVPMRVFGAAKAAHGPLMSAVRAIPEYLGPTIGMPWKQNLAIGTVGGGVLGKLGEMIDGDEQRTGFADGGPVNPRTGALLRFAARVAGKTDKDKVPPMTTGEVASPAAPVVSLDEARETKQVGNFHKSLMNVTSEMSRAMHDAGLKLHEEGLLPYPVGARFTTEKTRSRGDLPYEVTGHYVDPKNLDRYGYRYKRGDDESGMLLLNDPRRESMSPEMQKTIADSINSWQLLSGPKKIDGFADGGPVNPRAGALVQLGRGIARRIGEGTGYKSVPGKPATVEIPTIGRVETLPIPELEDAAARYMQSVGRPGEHVIGEYPEFDEDLARRLSRAYDEMKHDPSDPRVQRSYQALADETMAQLDAIKGGGLDIRFLKPGMEDPYARSPALGYADIVENNRLYTYPTDFGFGSTDANAELLSKFKHPMLTPIGRLGDKDNAVVNDAFRVVHDAFGHFGPGNPFFRHKGEERAWLNHAPMYSPDARPAAAVELRGQNSYLNFGPNAEHNAKASGADTIYADQKLGLMPEWTWTEKSQKKPVQKAEGGEVEQPDDGVAPIREEISSARSLVESGGVDALRAAIESGEVSTVAAIAALHDFSQDDKGGEGFADGGPVEGFNYSNMSFNRAFRLARQRALAGGEQTFWWKGNKYGTKLRDEVRQENANRQQRARSQQPPAPPPPAPAGAQQMPATAVPVPPGGEVASGATQPLQATQPQPATVPLVTGQPSAPQGPVLTPVAPVGGGDPYQGYPTGMGTLNPHPLDAFGGYERRPPSAGYYGDVDPMANQGGVQLGYPRAQSQYDLDMQRYTGMPYAAMDNATAFKRGGRVGALSAVARRAAR
jgi:hypothetical protein